MDNARALVTGVSGFAGSHLAHYLLQAGVEVVGLTRRPSHNGKPKARLTLVQADLSDHERLARLLGDVRPDLVFHLAGQSFVPRSWIDPLETYVSNVFSQLQLLRGVLLAGIDPLVLVIGSQEEYGPVPPEELPVAESRPLQPVNPYGVSKVTQDLMGLQYWLSHRLRCVRVRPFNHIGPGQDESFVVSAFARQVAEAEAGLRPPVIHFGNLSARRDFTDVRDIARAYHLALLRGEPGDVYNVGSGCSVPIQQVLDYFVANSRVTLQLEPDRERFRPTDTPATLCDSTKFRARTGWQPNIPLEQSLADTLAYWRDAVQARAREGNP
ncbi:MAG: GDP-mannose 4,6-dehydratase [Chloroflexi bacterium]|nr:GDP-mannose 4,6-dehydratase [Chloroflexota bacterium]